MPADGEQGIFCPRPPSRASGAARCTLPPPREPRGQMAGRRHDLQSPAGVPRGEPCRDGAEVTPPSPLIFLPHQTRAAWHRAGRAAGQQGLVPAAVSTRS